MFTRTTFFIITEWRREESMESDSVTGTLDLFPWILSNSFHIHVIHVSSWTSRTERNLIRAQQLKSKGMSSLFQIHEDCKSQGISLNSVRENKTRSIAGQRSRGHYLHRMVLHINWRWVILFSFLFNRHDLYCYSSLQLSNTGGSPIEWNLVILCVIFIKKSFSRTLFFLRLYSHNCLKNWNAITLEISILFHSLHQIRNHVKEQRAFWEKTPSLLLSTTRQQTLMMVIKSTREEIPSDPTFEGTLVPDNDNHDHEGCSMSGSLIIIISNCCLFSFRGRFIIIIYFFFKLKSGFLVSASIHSKSRSVPSSEPEKHHQAKHYHQTRWWWCETEHETKRKIEMHSCTTFRVHRRVS